MPCSKKSRSRRPKSLSHSRIPTLKAKSTGLSSKATRNLIRSHHRLMKQRAQALNSGNQSLVNDIDKQIQENGGLESYQLASKLGQSSDRGGDSSKVLIDWIGATLGQFKNTSAKLRLLEVGALSTRNACSLVQSLDVTRIDLNSQEAGIQQQDFMERPIPQCESDRFHLISLSLVLNYVPDATARGNMLTRCVSFLTNVLPPQAPTAFTPCVFLVLPVACVDNSRYLTEARLQEIMSSLGFLLKNSKKTNKLVYQLWEYHGNPSPKPFKKELLSPGGSKNNFAIIVRRD
ncbi:hypothetical protein ASPZODRAFT_90621 [Penicilliopsis zonata CBS 506.65]|uniref:25S rRNA adenine-N(1) methyltransferase n=1 Tax=Penicilliopsis zonata CBS 506.65 TaxID=1073090 RepID=A0A1L9SNF0_9EURO|nr:hypothetical protein ASPZODRAFT_90621 [Penicilliopsis zonata CBS 506.65]OJJ48779.1 hypothetical protein ASPZODRAFT_90621 [Penicilliopsis zonata CBS 506.65]